MPISISGGGSSPLWARFSTTTTQTITTGTSVAAGNKLAFQRIEKSDSWPTVTVPISDITIPATGLWLIMPWDLDWQDQVSGLGVGSRRMFRRITNQAASSRAHVIGPPTLDSAADIQTVQTGGEVRPFTAGSTIQFHAVQNSGASLEVAMAALSLVLLAPMSSNPYLDTEN